MELPPALIEAMSSLEKPEDNIEKINVTEEKVIEDIRGGIRECERNIKKISEEIENNRQSIASIRAVMKNETGIDANSEDGDELALLIQHEKDLSDFLKAEEEKLCLLEIQLKENIKFFGFKKRILIVILVALVSVSIYFIVGTSVMDMVTIQSPLSEDVYVENMYKGLSTESQQVIQEFINSSYNNGTISQENITSLKHQMIVNLSNLDEFLVNVGQEKIKEIYEIFGNLFLKKLKPWKS
jgi:hypothetical protein